VHLGIGLATIKCIHTYIIGYD